MRITGVEVFKLRPRWIFLRLKTDEGIDGWGECVSGTRTETIVSCIQETVAEHLLNRDPQDIEDIWQCLYRYFFRGGPVHMTVISGIEMALWDIKGKAAGLPVYQMLGGRARDKIRVYSWIGGDRPSDVVNQAKARVTA